MSLTVLQMAHSPFCIPITRALEACGAPFEVENVPAWDRTRIAEATDARYYQVPTLLAANQAIIESSARSQNIAKWVDREFAGGRLFPSDLAGLHEIVIEYLEDEVEFVGFRLMDPFYLEELDPVHRLLTVRHKERKFGPGCVDDWRRDHSQLVSEFDGQMQRFESMLAQRPWLLLECHPVFADFLLYGIIANATWKGWNELPESCPRVRAWNTRMQQFHFPSS